MGSLFARYKPASKKMVKIDKSALFAATDALVIGLKTGSKSNEMHLLISYMPYIVGACV